MPAKAKPKILSVRVYSELDEYPDLSYIGAYGREWKQGAVDRKVQGDWDSNEYQYFYPAIAEYAALDYSRYERYNKGLWWTVGICADAEIQTPSGMTQTIRGGCLSGIESDSGVDYFRETANEQLNELKDELEAFGFTEAQIKKAIDARDDSDLLAFHSHENIGPVYVLKTEQTEPDEEPEEVPEKVYTDWKHMRYGGRGTQSQLFRDRRPKRKVRTYRRRP